MQIKNYVMKKIVILLTAILGVAFVAVAFNKAVEKEIEKVVLTDTYFEFVGAPGEEGDPSKWEATNDASGCSGQDRACKIQVKSSFLQEMDGETHINTDMLPELPTALSPDGVNLVPSPNAAGTSPTQPIVPNQIYNQD